MKHTKKMVLVPEVEYSTLLNLLKGENPLATEKAVLETKMSKVLQDPSLNELVKGKRHDWMLKRRRQLKNELRKEAEQPKRVLLDDEQLKSIKSATAVPRYLGVELPVAAVAETSTQKQQRRKKAASETPKAAKAVETAPKTYVIHPNYHGDVLKILKQNKKKIGITDKNDLSGVPDSNINEIIDFLTGASMNKPGGTDILLERIKDMPWFKQGKEWAEWHQQRGEGKRRRRRTNRIITAFRPTLWARL